MVDEIRNIEISSIRENPNQPRKSFSQMELEELAASIREIGLIHPPVVREIGLEKYELVAGERRLRALKLLGCSSIPVLIKEMSDPLSCQSALIENIQRVDLNPIEVAYALKELMTHCKLTQESLATKVGKKRSTVANFLRLLQLPEEIQELVKNGRLTMGHAKAVLSIPAEGQKSFCEELVEKQLSVREAEGKAQEILNKASSSAEPCKKPRNVFLDELKMRLEHKYGTKVEMTENKIAFAFYGWDDLDRLLELLNL